MDHAFTGGKCVPRVVANRPALVANTPKPVVANSRHGKYADPDKRRAYMRDLMRKRRQR